MEEQLPCSQEILQPLKDNITENPKDDEIKQQNINQARAIVRQKRKIKKTMKDQKCKKKKFHINFILKNAQKDINGLRIEKSTENSVILSLQTNQSHEEKYIFRPIALLPVYFIAGDVIIEPRDTLNGEERIRHVDIFNNFRNVTSVESYKNFLQFTMESVKPLLNLEEIIYCLENSQDASNYEYAQSLRRYQPAILLVEDLINKVIHQYDSNPADLQEFLKQREAYFINQQNKMIEELGNQGVFASVCFHSLSFQNKTFQVTHLSLTKQSVRFLGADFNSMLTYLLRQGSINFMNYQSRRMIFRSTIDYYSEINQTLQFTIPSFEILTADGIRFTCECDVSCKSVEFPEDLQFKGAEVEQLNHIESISVMRFKLTPKIIRSVLEIRESMPSNFADKIELSCFEYAMRSSILLDKYYPDISKYPNKFCQNEDKLPQCGYRRIQNLNDSTEESTENEKIQI